MKLLNAPMGGDLLYDVIAQATAQAIQTAEVCTFDFNGEEYSIEPTESFKGALARLSATRGYPIQSRDEMAEQAKRDIEERARVFAEAIAATGAATEQQLRDADVPWPKSEEDLTAYIRGLVDRPHDYGTCVYAMSMAAVAAFYYVSSKLGVTGFQASCADLDIIRRTRHMKDGFSIVDWSNILYPQYWDDERTPGYQSIVRKNHESFAKKAAELLAEREDAPPALRNHWRWLVEYCAEVQSCAS